MKPGVSAYSLHPKASARGLPPLAGPPPTAHGFGAAGAGVGAGVVGAVVVGAGALGAVALGPLGVTAGFIVSGIHRPTISNATTPARTTSSQGKRDFR